MRTIRWSCLTEAPEVWSNKHSPQTEVRSNNHSDDLGPNQQNTQETLTTPRAEVLRPPVSHIRLRYITLHRKWFRLHICIGMPDNCLSTTKKWWSSTNWCDIEDIFTGHENKNVASKIITFTKNNNQVNHRTKAFQPKTIHNHWELNIMLLAWDSRARMSMSTCTKFYIVYV